MKSFWDERYSAPGFAYGEAPNDFLVEVAPRLKVGRALCLAEGEGRNAVHLAALGFEVTAVDQSAVGLAKAEALAASRGLKIATVCADLAGYELGEGWDAIISIWCHVPGRLRERLHADVVRALAPGGHFVLEAYTPDQISLGTGGPRDLDLLMTAASVAAEAHGLDFDILEERRRDIHEGPFHEGPSAVVVALGRRPAL